MPKNKSKPRVLAEKRADIDVGRFAQALLSFALHRLRRSDEPSVEPPPAPTTAASGPTEPAP